MRKTILACLLLVVVGCSANARDPGDDDTSGTSDAGGEVDAQSCGEPCASHCPGTTATYLSGVVLAPNGVDPVAGASVFVPLTVAPFPDTVACELCGDQIANAAVMTHTAPDGSFRLGPIPTSAMPTPGATISVVAQKGRFRRLAQVAIQSWCSDNSAQPDALRLPSRREDSTNTIPRIAVVSGMYDDMECVLTKLGIDADAFDMYAGEPLEVVPSGNDFLRDPARLAGYNIVFINCGNAYELELMLDDQVKTNLRDYVAAGGRLYVTDQSYTFIEQVPEWAGTIDFGPGTSAAAPEPMDAADIGDDGITTEAQVEDATLVDWLRAIEVRTGETILSGGRVHIEGFVGGWAMQLAVAAVDSAKVWINGQVSGLGLTGDLPLTTTFDVDSCGRVTYSSYHTLGRPIQPPNFPDYCTAAPLLPQERILEYLILNAADCIVVQ
jgi:hypothetical protein